MIELPKATESSWVDLGEDQKILVDYPKVRQEHYLQDLLLKARNDDGEMDMVAFMEYARYYVRYTIKDWEGFGMDCTTKKGELKDDLWFLLTKDITQTQTLFASISEALKWGDVEKKS